MESPQLDAAAIVEEISAEVARKRAAGEYPAQLLAQLDVEFATEPGEAPLEELAHLETVRELRSERPVLGRAVVVAKRAVRRAVAWYVRPVVQDQTRLNFALVRRIYDLEARVAELEAALGEQRGGGPRAGSEQPPQS
jgi:hypothetical protein